MKPKQKIYLDTSVPSRYYDDDRHEEQRVTQLWWKNDLHGFEVAISKLTRRELEATPHHEKRQNLLKLVKGIKTLPLTKEAKALADKYLESEVVPNEYKNDALHIAISTVNKCDILVSWNFTHMVNHETRIKVSAVNILNGYGEIKIESPLELGGGNYVR